MPEEEHKEIEKEEGQVKIYFNPELTSIGFGSMNSARLDNARKKYERRKKSKKKQFKRMLKFNF